MNSQTELRPGMSAQDEQSLLSQASVRYNGIMNDATPYSVCRHDSSTDRDAAASS